MLHLRLAVLVGGSALCAASLSAQASLLTLPSPLVVAVDSSRELHAPPRAALQVELPRLLPPHALSVTRTAPHFVRMTLLAVGASVVLSPLDAPVMREIGEVRAPDGSMRRTADLSASLLGSIAPVTVGPLLWAGGALLGHDVVQHVGMEATQAVLLSGALANAAKGLVGRARPNASPDDPDRYFPGRGYFNASRASFPSGHTTAAFALATVLSRELSGRYPSKKWLIRSALYGAAGSVGLARMYQNAHWPSDIVTGATLGTLSGMQALAWHAGRR